jgi:DNA invertase Pin-like site-specific DNA recombinase
MPATSAAPVSYSYVRFSTPKQAEGDSLRRQTTAAAAWCQRNGARLDESTTLHDLGKSAYTGSHRQNPDRNALASFLKLVEAGRVPRGSFLIIENLDRLSREHIQPALLLVLNLLQAGIRIVQLAPSEMVFDDNSDTMPVMMMMMELSRGHGESAMKSNRLSKAWDAKRSEIGRRKLSGKGPFWLTLSEDKTRFVKKPEAVALVQRIYRMGREGYGSATIAKKLNAEGVSSPYGKPWNNVSVLHILRSRAVLGEFTPHRGPANSRVPAGPPIADYFPRIIQDDEFWAVQNAIKLRLAQRGPRGRRVANLFTGLLKDARDGEPIYLNEKRPGDIRMVSAGAVRGRPGAGHATFPYQVFEQAVLSQLREIDPREVLGQDKSPDEAMSLAGQLERVEAKIAELEAELVEGDVATIAKVLRQQEAKKADLVGKLSEAKARAASPVSDAWGEYRTLADVLVQAKDPEDARTRLRAVLRRIVESMNCLIVPQGRFMRIAAVQIHFAGGSHRDYLVLHQTPRNDSPKGKTPRTEVRSFADEMKAGELDLRRKADAAKLAKLLATVNPADFEKRRPRRR